MSFENTNIFHDLVKHFASFGESIRYDAGKEEKARELARKHAKIRGEANIRKVCAKANQKLKMKLYSI